MNRLFSFSTIIILLLTACGGQPTAAPTTAPSERARTATLSEVVNVVEARAAEAEAFAQADDGLALGVGSQVRTGEASSVRLDFSEGTIVRVAQNSSFVVRVLEQETTNALTRLALETGKIWVSLTGGSVEVETPVGVASVRGSFAVFEYDPGDPDDPTDDVLVISCIEGECQAQNENFDETAGNLERIVLSEGGEEVTRIVLTGDDVQEFISNNPEVGAAIVATLTAAPSATLPPTETPTASSTFTATIPPSPTETATASPAPTDTNTPRPPATRTPAPTSTLADTPTPEATPLPSCTPPEFFDPFLNRCRLNSDFTAAPSQTDAPPPTPTYDPGF
ncbi:MAG: FecR domain-containing protein [Chloroflexi bacterium]|nr:FecR domain-containing protein [Chloroflexota bacterium]